MDLKKLIEPNHQECIQLKQTSNERRLMITTSQKWKNITIGCVFYGFLFVKQTFKHVDYTSKNDQLLTTYKLDI